MVYMGWGEEQKRVLHSREQDMGGFDRWLSSRWGKISPAVTEETTALIRRW